MTPCRVDEFSRLQYLVMSLFSHASFKIDVLGFLCSPYSMTIFSSNPQQGKLTVKADLIFEEYIGIDIHQKLLVVKENNSTVNHKRGNKQPSFFPPPKEVCVVEDENEATTQTPHQKLNKRIDSSMPSFNLLDEEIGEGKSAGETEDDDCKIISEETIFKHIRDKAKNFPVLTTSKDAHSTSTKPPLILSRKRSREKHLELSDVLDVPEETEVSNFPQVTLLHLSSEPKEPEQKGHGFNKHLIPKCHLTAGSLGTINLMDKSVGLPSQHGDTISKTLTEDTIFDHIRKKSKNFPMYNFNLSNTTESEPLIQTNEHSSENQSEFCSGASDIPKDTNFIANKTETSSLKMLSFDISMMKKNKRFGEAGSSMEVTKMQKYSPSASGRQCSPLAPTEKSREPHSFLGLKSVFSFL
ncbi:hypothetical protein Pint_02771 [Pistacia integerrima]|uniref:Uncharacterized protein n=1 Tax=Pistacia integerrima TaxID=434235 RepID=A0ACC0ZRP9_9ROSI|nr:hypothetical protein Pint_02771 [Pistacia integerrima]